jgi:hypothetical protein
MVPEMQQQRPSLDDLIAELTAAAYPIALRHQASNEWLDLELELWWALAQTVKNWDQRAALPCSR